MQCIVFDAHKRYTWEGEVIPQSLWACAGVHDDQQHLPLLVLLTLMEDV